MRSPQYQKLADRATHWRTTINAETAGPADSFVQERFCVLCVFCVDRRPGAPWTKRPAARAQPAVPEARRPRNALADDDERRNRRARRFICTKKVLRALCVLR